MVRRYGRKVAIDRPGQQRWTWTRRVPPRWLLDGYTGNPQFPGDGDVLALCADIDGLFVDLPPRPRERFTLLGCVPDGVLAASLDSDPAATPLDGGRGWLGNLWVSAMPDDRATRDGWFGVYLLDVTVLGQRPSTTSPGRVDVDLDGLVHVYDPTDAVDRPGGITGFVLRGPDDTPYGACADITGVFRDQGEPPVPYVVLVGCQPEPLLQAAIAAVPQSTKAGLRRRRVTADVKAIAADGSALPLIGGGVYGTIVSSVPSPLDDGLLDVTIASETHRPYPTGKRRILELWLAGRPAERNLWAGYDRTLRHEWSGMALACRRFDLPDQPAGTVFDLDGRFVTDIEGFYCAIGEAINGPGGYFGWNLDALSDCLRSRWGARTPFRLVWHDSAVAREHLVPGYDRHRYEPAVTLDHLRQMLTAHGVEVHLR